jgi:alpha-glucosidase (family GH31 glycosyl hydrolase)
MLNLRYALLPYNYTMAHRAYEDGLPLARPLIVGYPHDDRFVNESTEFLWGDDFLVAPVLEAGATSRRVVFPAGDWVNFWTDSVVHGGSTRDVSAPLDRIPLFVRAGSIIPMAPAMDYTDERPLDTLRLSVYPAAGTNSSALLYEDDGHTTAYRSGDFALTRFTQSVTGTGSRRRIVLTIGRSKGEYTGKILKRTYIIDVHGIVAAPVVATCRSDSSVAISFPAPSK